MAEVSRETGRVLKCGFNHRHHPAIWEAHRRLEAGELGRPVFARCRYGICGRPGYEKEWRADPARAAGGQFIEQGTHGIDLIRWFLGDIAEVGYMTATHFFKEQPLEDDGFAIFRTDAGGTASLHTSLVQWQNLFSFEVFGDEGYARVEGLGAAYGTEQLFLGRRDFTAPFQDQVIQYRGGDISWRDEWREFAAAVREQREPVGGRPMVLPLPGSRSRATRPSWSAASFRSTVGTENVHEVPGHGRHGLHRFLPGRASPRRGVRDIRASATVGAGARTIARRRPCDRGRDRDAAACVRAIAESQSTASIISRRRVIRPCRGRIQCEPIARTCSARPHPRGGARAKASTRHRARVFERGICVAVGQRRNPGRGRAGSVKSLRREQARGGLYGGTLCAALRDARDARAAVLHHRTAEGRRRLLRLRAPNRAC